MKYLLAFVMLTVVAAMGQTTTTGKMRDECRQSIRMADGVPVTDKEAMDAAHCLGFVQGFSNGWAMFDGFTFKDGVTFSQMIRVFVAYVDKNPEFEHMDIYSSFIMAITLADLRNPTPAKKTK